MAKKCQNCNRCSRSAAGKVLATVTGANTVGKAGFGMTVGLFKKKCPICKHYQSEHNNK